MARDLIPRLGLPNGPPVMIALVGAGGKTTTMMDLAREYRALSSRVLVTTTTRIYVPSEECRDFLVIGTDSPAMKDSVPGGTVTVAGEAIEDNGKMVGVEAGRLNDIFLERIFDVVLVEADGSRGKPLKAPAAYEPVIPGECTHVIGIIGMDAFGQPINDGWVHRLKEFIAVTGAAEGQIIDENILLKLIESQVGLFKNAPHHAKRILLLNKCSNTTLSEAADSVISTCMNTGIGNLYRGVRQ